MLHYDRRRARRLPEWAQVREAVSWGKVKERAKQVTLHAEVTTVLPFLISYALAKRKPRRA